MGAKPSTPTIIEMICPVAGCRDNYGGVRCTPGILVVALLLGGCTADKPPLYQDHRGFRITPPSGWALRVREDAMSAHVSHRQPNLPLPPLGIAGKSPREQVLARYDRAIAGAEAWLRVSLVELASSVPLAGFLRNKAPGPKWKQEAAVEQLDLGGLPAARIAWVGRWDDRDYLCESVGVRKGSQVYVITASFPAADATARAQAREAVSSSAWP